MKLKSKFSATVGIFTCMALVVACGTDKSDPSEQGGMDYETALYSADMDEAQFDAFLLDSIDEKAFEDGGSSSMSLAEEVKAEEVKSEEGAAGQPSTDVDLEAHRQKMTAIKQQREEREKREAMVRRSKPAPVKQVPAFVQLLKESKDYVRGLLGIDLSPFENFRKKVAELHASSKSKEEFKLGFEKAREELKAELEARRAGIEAARVKHASTIEAIKAARKEVVAACAIKEEREIAVRKPVMPPEKKPSVMTPEKKPSVMPPEKKPVVAALAEEKPAPIARKAPTQEEIESFKKEMAAAAAVRQERSPQRAQMQKSESCATAMNSLSGLIHMK